MTEINAIRCMLENAGARIAFSLDSTQLEQIADFCLFLARYNAHTNLVSNAELVVVLKEHVLDSLTLVPTIVSRKALPGKTKRLIDIGSGAGFPGLILAIAIKDLSVTLLEAVGKKTRFLQDTVKQLSLSERVEVRQARAEELAHQEQYRRRFDLATGRAIGSLAVVAELAAPFLRSGGVSLVQKTVKQSAEEEPGAQANLHKLGARLMQTIILDAEVLGKERAIMIIEQVKPAKAEYPRQWAELKRSPLF